MLKVKDVRKRLGSRRILDGVSLSCDSGEVAVILGENGAGKSTLLRIVAGLIEPDSGDVSIRGASLRGGGRKARAELGYVPDATQMLPDLLVEEFVALVRALKQLANDAPTEIELRWRERFGLTTVWGQRFSTLSFGQRKRACTVAALAGDPWLLVLDEPSNGLDPEAIELMIELIAERRTRGGATVLVSNDSACVERVAGVRYRLGAGHLHEGARPSVAGFDEASPA